MQYAREDIADLRSAPTYGSCERLHLSIRGYREALLDCGLISGAQKKQLMAEANAELAGWQAPEVLPSDWAG
jgi:hypothetical protein